MKHCIVKYVRHTRYFKDLDDCPALLLYDMHKSNINNEAFNTMLTENTILNFLIPAAQTKDLQPMDMGPNKAIKDGLRTEFNSYYSSHAIKWMNDGKKMEDFKIDLRWSVIKNYHAQWIVTTLNNVGNNTGLMQKAWRAYD